MKMQDLQNSPLLTRRSFLQALALATAGMGVVACAPVQPGGATAPAAPAADAPASGGGTTVLGDALPADAAPYDQQIYRAMVFTEPQHLERAAGVSGSGSFYPFYTTEPLVKINEDLELVGAIAESWQLEEDGLTWTFKIRPGLEWSDGTPLTAKDVEFTYQRIAHPDIAFDWAWFFYDIENLEQVSTGELPLTELGVKMVDDATVQFKTKAPAPYFPDKTLMVTISPAHVIGEVNGIKVRSGLRLLYESAATRSIEEWATICDIAPATIVELAREFTSHGKKAVADPHRGVSQHTNGFYNVLARYIGRYIGVHLASNFYIEAQWYLYSLVFFLGFAYILKHDINVRVDFLYTHWSNKTKTWVNLLGTLIFLIPFCIMGIYVTYNPVLSSWGRLPSGLWGAWEMSPDPDGLPRYARFPPLLALLRARQTRSSLGSPAPPTHRSNSSNRRLAFPDVRCDARLRRRGGGRSKPETPTPGFAFAKPGVALF